MLLRLTHTKQFLLTIALMELDERLSLDERWAEFVGHECPLFPYLTSCHPITLQAVRFLVIRERRTARLPPTFRLSPLQDETPFGRLNMTADEITASLQGQLEMSFSKALDFVNSLPTYSLTFRLL